MRGPWFGFNKVIDSDTTNFKELVDEIVDKFPCGYGDVVKLFYFCADSKSNIEIHSDQDLMNMFAKHMTSKCHHMSIAYHKPDVDPPKIPLWDNVEMPCTPSMSAPSYVEPSKATQSGTVTKPDYDMVEDNKFMNPEPQNEYVGVDEEGLYIDIAPTSHANVDTSEKKDEDYDPGSNSESESDSESDMDAEVDEIIKDTLPSHISEVAYNKNDPPIEVGSIYPNMFEFKLALATHAIKNEFDYNIEKSYKFVVNLKERTCSCRAWEVSGLPCKHAIAFITSIPGEKIEDHVDNYYSIQMFRAAYEGKIPSLPDKSMWPKSEHGFFMHPPLLKSTAGRRRQNRYKAAVEGGSKGAKGRHQCPICQQYGHHWYTCKDGDPNDIAAMLAERYQAS